MSKTYQEFMQDYNAYKKSKKSDGYLSAADKFVADVKHKAFTRDMNSWQTEFNNYLAGGVFDDETDNQFKQMKDNLLSRYKSNAKAWGYNDDNNDIANSFSSYDTYMNIRGEQKLYDSYNSFGKTFSSLVENVNNLTKGANDRFSEKTTLDAYSYNEDVTVRDASKIAKYVAGLYPQVKIGPEYAGADYNGDGSVNIKDTTSIQKHVARIESLQGKETIKSIEIAPYRGYDAEEYYNNTKKTGDEILLQGDELAAAYAQYGDVWKEKGFVDDETAKLIESVLGDYKSIVNGVVNVADTDKNQWSKFSSKRDYYDAVVKTDWLDNANLTEERNKLEEMKGFRDAIEEYENSEGYSTNRGNLQDWVKHLYKEAGWEGSNLGKVNTMVSEQEDKVNFLEQNQYQYNIKKELEKRDDFAQISQESTDKDKYNDFITEHVFLKLATNKEIGNMAQIGTSSASIYGEGYYEYMSDEEKALAWALYNTNDDRLDTYLSKIKSGVHQRKAGNMDTDSFGGKLSATLDYVYSDWLDDGVRLLNMLTQSEEVMGADYTDFALQNAKDNSSGFGNFLIDATTTLGNMAPALLVGTVASPVAGAVYMGVDAGTSGYQQMIDAGYGSDVATRYGILSGAAETVTRYLLSGIGKLGGKVTNNVASKFVAGVDSALAKWGLTMTVNGFGEFTEEALQTILEPTLQRMAGMSEEDIESVDWGEVIYNGLLGAFSSLLLEGPSNAGVEVNTKNVGKDISASPEAVNQLKNLGGSLGTDTTAYKLTNKLNENSSAYQVGRAFQEVGAEIENITKKASKGINRGAVNTKMDEASTVQSNETKIAKDAINVLLNGGTLTSSQMSAIESVSETNENFKQATGLAKDLNEVSNLASLASAVVTSEKNSQIRQKRIDKEKVKVNKAVEKLTSEYSDLADVVDINDIETISDLKSDERYSTDDNFKKQVDAILEQDDVVSQMQRFEKENEEATDFVRSELGMPTKRTDVSADNNTYYTPTGEQVEIKGVVQAGKDLRLLVNKNGKTERVKVSDVSFENEMVATAYNMLDEISVPSKYMTSLVNLIDTNGKTKRGSVQIKALAEVFGYGEIGATAQQISKLAVSEYLTDRQIEMALKYGQSNASRNTNKAQQDIDAKIASTVSLRADLKYNKTKGKKGKFEHDFTSKELAAMKKENPKKYKVYKTVETLSKILPVDMVLIDTTKAKWEEYKNANGFYRDKTVYVDINAEVNGENTVLFTLSHELVHFIKDTSPAKYKVLADFVFKEFMDNDVNIDVLIDSKIDALKELPEYKSMSEAELKNIAQEEVVAEACERMLVDSKAVEKLAELKKQDKGLFNQIKQFITGFFNKIIERYKKLSPSSAEAKLVQEIEGMSEKLQKLFEDALLDAVETQRVVGEENTTFESNVKMQGKKADAEYMKAVKKNDVAKLDKFVEQEARQNGFDSPKLYHGTQRFGFTEFDLSKMDDGRSIFLTSSKELASTYSGVGGSRVIIEDANVDFDNLNGEDVANLMSKYTSTNTFEYFDESGLIKNVNSELKTLEKTIKKLKKEFSSEISAIETLEDLEWRVRDYRLNGYNEWSYKDIKNAFNNALENSYSFYGKRELITGLRDKISAIKKLKTNKKYSDGIIVETDLNGYQFLYNINEAKNTLLSDVNRGNYSFYAKLGKSFVVDGKGAVWNKISYKVDGEWRVGKTRDIAAYAKETGYDSVTIKNIIDSGGKNYNISRDFKADVYIMFDPNSVKSADPVTYDDNGNVIPLSERFDNTKSNIRFQRKTTATQNGLPEGVIKYQLKNTDNLSDTELLAQYLERNGQVAQSVLRKVGNIEISNTKAKRLVSSRLREYGVVGSVAKESAEYIATVLEIASHPEVEGRDIVSDITTEIKRAIESTPYEFNINAEEYAEIVQTLKDYGNKRVYLTEDQEAHVREQDYNIKWLRQRLFGKLNIVKKTQFSDMNEIRLDDVYSDLSERFPTIFPTKDSPTRRAVDSSEYAMDLVDKLDYLGTGQSLSIEEAFGDDSQTVATRIMSDIVADFVQTKQNSKSNPYVSDLTEKLKERYKKETKERLEKQRQSDRKRMLEREKKAKERNAETLEKAKNRHYKSELRQKIKKLESELRTSLLKPTANKYIPAEMANAVVDILSAVNMDTVAAAERMAKYDKLIEIAEKNGNFERADALRVTRENIGDAGKKITDKINAVAVMYSNYKKNNKNTHAYDEYLAEMLNGLSITVEDTPIRLMTAEQLQEVYNVFTALNTVITNANKMLLEGKKMRIRDFSKMVKSEIEGTLKPKDSRPELLKKASATTWNLLKPFYAFENIGSETFIKLYWDLQKGERVAARDYYEARNFLEEKRKFYKWRTWKFKREEVFELESGKKMQLNLEQKMLIYNMWKDEDARKHITGSGFVFDSGESFRKVKEKTDEKGNKKTYKTIFKYVHSTNDVYKLSAKDVESITKTLSSEQKEYADSLEQYLSNVMGAKGNEAFRKLYGYDKFTKKNYTPIQCADDFVVSLNSPVGEVMLKNSSFTKDRVPGASNPIVLRSYEQVWLDHVTQMSTYHGLVVPIDTFNKVMNYSEYISDGELDDAWGVKTVIDSVHGKAAVKYMTDFIQDLNGGVSGTKKIENIALKTFAKGKKVAVGASLSTAVQQPMAVIRAMSEINPMYFAIPKTSDGKLINHFEIIKKYSEVAILKEIGGFDAGSSRSAKEYIDGTHTAMGHVDNVAMYLSTKADEIGWSIIWVATINEQQAKQGVKLRNLKGEAREKFLKSCGERFNEVIVKTQVYDSVFSRSDLMRSDSDMAKFLTSFMGEPTTSLNMLRSAVVQAKRKKISKRHAARIVSAVYVSIVAAAAVSSLVYAMRDDEEEDEAFLNKWAYHFGDKLVDEINPLNMIPYTRDLMSIVSGFSVSRPDTDLIEDIVRAFKNLSKEDMSAVDKVTGFAGSVANLLGIPAGNAIRDGKAIYNLVKDLFDENIADFEGIKDAFVRGAAFGKELELSNEEKRQRLHTYLVAGNDEEIKKIRDEYTDKNGVYDDKKFHSEIRTMLREHDTRIKEAAQAHIDGDIKRRGELTEEIYNSYSNEYVFLKDIKSAINSEIEALVPDDDKNKGEVEKEGKYRESVYTTDDVNAAFDAGDDAYARVFITDIISAKTEEYIAKGQVKEDAEKSAKGDVRSGMTEHWKPLYVDALKKGNTDEVTRIKDLIEYSGVYDDLRGTFGSWEKEAEISYNQKTVWIADDVIAAFDKGDVAAARDIMQDVKNSKIEEYIQDGKDEEEAEKDANSYIQQAMTRYWKEEYKTAYLNSDYSEKNRIKGILKSSGVYKDVYKTVGEWEKSFKKQ